MPLLGSDTADMGYSDLSFALVRVFNSRARYLLLAKEGHLVQVFTDPLTSIQQQILDLLSISPKAYA
jgi:hypothetical protein